MARINEHEIFARYIGEKVNSSRLAEIAEANGNGYGDYADSKEYIIAHASYCEAKKYQELFGLTPVLIDRWAYKGIDFRICLYVRDGIITGGHIHKYVNTCPSSHFRSAGYETDATGQEIRIVGRILSYVISEV